MSSFNVGEVLSALKQVARETGVDGKENDTSWGSNTPSSTKQLLLQTSALHKGFLALSEAIQENIGKRQVWLLTGCSLV